jgi:hypothetical protein
MVKHSYQHMACGSGSWKSVNKVSVVLMINHPTLRKSCINFFYRYVTSNIPAICLFSYMLFQGHHCPVFYSHRACYFVIQRQWWNLAYVSDSKHTGNIHKRSGEVLKWLWIDYLVWSCLASHPSSRSPPTWGVHCTGQHTHESVEGYVHIFVTWYKEFYFLWIKVVCSIPL